MFRESVLLEFLCFGLFYVIWKAVFHLINIESRRAGMTTVAGVSGLLA
jgi:hypothetical protein